MLKLEVGDTLSREGVAFRVIRINARAGWAVIEWIAPGAQLSWRTVPLSKIALRNPRWGQYLAR